MSLATDVYHSSDWSQLGDEEKYQQESRTLMGPQETQMEVLDERHSEVFNTVYKDVIASFRKYGMLVTINLLEIAAL